MVLVCVDLCYYLRYDFCFMFLCYLNIMLSCLVVFVFFFFKQKTAYEMRISDWSSDVCSSDLGHPMKISGVDIRPGNIIEYEKGLWRAVKIQHTQQIGRASCRERVCQYV